MTSLVSATDDDAAEIIRLHTEIHSLAQSTIENAIRIGEILSKKKADLQHGEWLPWQEKNIPSLSHDTVSRYIAVFERHDEFRKMRNLTDVYRLMRSANKAKQSENESRGKRKGIYPTERKLEEEERQQDLNRLITNLSEAGNGKANENKEPDPEAVLAKQIVEKFGQLLREGDPLSLEMKTWLLVQIENVFIDKEIEWEGDDETSEVVAGPSCT